MEWTDGRWLHPCYPKCIKFVSKMKANLSLTQRDGSIHVIQNVSNCFPKWKQNLVLPKEMAPGSLWIGNVKVNVVHVLVRDRARIKLERKKWKFFIIMLFYGPSSMGQWPMDSFRVSAEDVILKWLITALTTESLRSLSASSLFWTDFVAWFWCPFPMPLTASDIGSSWGNGIGL